MHTKSKLFPQGTLGGNGITHFKGKVPCIWDVTSLAFSWLLVLINLVLEKGISLSVLEILLIFKAGKCIPGCDHESYCSHHSYKYLSSVTPEPSQIYQARQRNFIHPMSKPSRRYSSITWQNCTAIWDLNLDWHCPSSSRDSSHQDCI